MQEMLQDVAKHGTEAETREATGTVVKQEAGKKVKDHRHFVPEEPGVAGP
jgi:hypothetical protein